MRVIGNERPESVFVERTHMGKLAARLTENVVEETVELDGENVTQFRYDEYVYEADWSEPLAARIRADSALYLVQAKAAERYKALSPEEILAQIEDRGKE